MSINQDDAEAQEKQKIMQDIYEEVNKIQNLAMAIQNNLIINSVVQTNHPSVEHATNIESLRVVLKENQASSSVDRDNVEKDILEQLEREGKGLESDLARVANLIKINNENILRINDNINILKEMVAKNINSQNKNSRLDAVEKNVKLRFRAEKRDLKTIIDAVFPDNVELQDMIANVIQHNMTEGPDKYLTLEYKDGISEMIETLSQSTLIDVNPRDSLQVKLADLI